MPIILNVVLSAMVLLCGASFAHAQARHGSLFTAETIKASAPNPSSVFIGRGEGGMFADLPVQNPTVGSAIAGKVPTSHLNMIRAVIQEAESKHNGYDAVQQGARIKPKKRPTQMTLNEIFAWIEATPGQPHAIGRYQFIPNTLRRVVAKTGVDTGLRFGPKVQDMLALSLIHI